MIARRSPRGACEVVPYAFGLAAAAGYEAVQSGILREKASLTSTRAASC